MRAYKQFYVDFEARSGAWNILPELAAVVANGLGPLSRIEFKRKTGAHEFVILAESGIEAKVGCNSDCRVWLHLSAPEDSDADLRELAHEIINHPAFLSVNREKQGGE